MVAIIYVCTTCHIHSTSFRPQWDRRFHFARDLCHSTCVPICFAFLENANERRRITPFSSPTLLQVRNCQVERGRLGLRGPINVRVRAVIYSNARVIRQCYQNNDDGFNLIKQCFFTCKIRRSSVVVDILRYNPFFRSTLTITTLLILNIKPNKLAILWRRNFYAIQNNWIDGSIER